jgi:NAD(P)-dependent dehydrogenase (short-subunit alcohol dehydrogenase family)
MTRLIIVTGAARGIGKAIADGLRAQGDEVIGIDRTEAEGLLKLDLSQPDIGEVLLARLEGRDVDVLVNSAAVFHSGTVAETDAQAWTRLFAVNLLAPYLLTRALAPGLSRRRGSVLNISSVNGQRNARANLVYDSLKAGLDHMTRGLALDLSAQGIRVNALAPGGTETPGLADWFKQATHLPMGAGETGAGTGWTERSIATAEEIAMIALFLLSPAARWINGAVILADNAAHLRAGQD